MKSLKWLSVIGLALVMTAGILIPISAAADKPIELRWCTFFPAAHPLFPMSQNWGTEIEEATGKQVKFR